MPDISAECERTIVVENTSTLRESRCRGRDVADKKTLEFHKLAAGSRDKAEAS